MLDLPIASNVVLPQLRGLRASGSSAASFETDVAEREQAARHPHASGRHDGGSRSGGNQQKVVLAKWLACSRGRSSSTSPRAASTWAPTGVLFVDVIANVGEPLGGRRS